MMTEKLELYKCHICGNLIQVLIPGDGELVCCGQKMEKLIANSNDNQEVAEKHVPQIEILDNKKIVTLKYHPMIEEHYIQFIEVSNLDQSKVFLKFLKPNQKAEFEIPEFEEDISALEYCNIHGLWRN